jgi:L-aminopeptidase/D-esterase-like protein
LSKPDSPLGAVGSITDVPGVMVGHHQRLARGWQTGTTVVVVPEGATPGVDVRGGGPGTRETDALAPTNLVGSIHAVCLTGGSAYGLAAADGVMSWLEQRGLGFPITGPDGSPPNVVPVVPAAVIFDLARGGRFDNRPDHSFGSKAAANARTTQNRWGTVGAGTGAVAGGLQGGVGTASSTARVPLGPATDSPETCEIRVGAVAVVNSYGTPFDRRSGLPWEPGGLGLRRPTSADRSRLRTLLDQPVAWPLNTTIGVIATSAELTKSEAAKLAAVAHDGLARAVRPAHALVDGDTIFALATGGQPLAAADANAAPLRIAALNQLFTTAAEVFATACTHAVVSATTTGTAPAYSTLCPSAFPSGSRG